MDTMSIQSTTADRIAVISIISISIDNRTADDSIPIVREYLREQPCIKPSSIPVVQSSLTLILPELISRFSDNGVNTEIIVAEASYCLPLALAILPFLILHLLKKRQRIRAATIQQSVCQSKADGATALYASMLEQQWQ
ncbi:hypothetical protein OSTOST_05150 [Ostertagia ostertagi]